MKEDKNGELTIGRVNKDVEKGLNLSFSNKTTIYISQKNLDSLCLERPKTYLKLLEEIESILSKPDWVSFFDLEETLLYIKEYIHRSRFVKIAVSICYEGEPRRFYFKKMWVPSEDELNAFLDRSTFARPKK